MNVLITTNKTLSARDVSIIVVPKQYVNAHISGLVFWNLSILVRFVAVCTMHDSRCPVARIVIVFSTREYHIDNVNCSSRSDCATHSTRSPSLDRAATITSVLSQTSCCVSLNGWACTSVVDITNIRKGIILMVVIK